MTRRGLRLPTRVEAGIVTRGDLARVDGVEVRAEVVLHLAGTLRDRVLIYVGGEMIDRS